MSSSLYPDRKFHVTLWSMIALVFVWSGIDCNDRLTWVMEVLPVVIGTIILMVMYPHLWFSRLVCWLLFAHAIVLMMGGHYTYAEVPIGNWLQEAFDWQRNHYDRLGHLLQGFVPAMVAREILIRRRVLTRGPWLNFLIVCVCLAISAVYEMLEWQAAVWTGGAADKFLGTQGDIWDTQWDMALAGIGAITALVTLSRLHDRSIGRVLLK